MAAFNTGDLGEAFVQLWASQGGFTANPPIRDRFGWDFCLQLHREANAASIVPLDRLPPELTCMVQVKTTARGIESESIALSNWERMVRHPLPYFFIRVFVDDAGEATRAVLVHVGESWIERVLRRLREIDPADGGELHERTLDLTWRDEEPLTAPFARSLRERIRSIVGNQDEYVMRKGQFVSNVGYRDRRRLRVTATTTLSNSNNDDIERAVDFAIGLEPRLPINSLITRDVRFDIPRPVGVERDFQSGYLECSPLPSIGQSTIRFADAKGCPSASLVCETYTPSLLFPRLADEHMKVRLVHPVLSLVVNPRTEAISVHWRVPETPISLSVLASGCAAINVLARAAPDNRVTMTYEDGGNGATLAEAHSPPQLSTPVRQLAFAAASALFLVRLFGQDQHAPVLAEDIHEQISQLTNLRAVFDRTFGTLNLRFGVTNGNPAMDDKRGAFVVPMSARIGDHVLAAIVVHVGRTKWHAETQHLSIENGDVRVLEQSLVRIDDWEDFDHEARGRRAADALSRTQEYDYVVGQSEEAL
jgi:hypothetical protein